ncbi:hypothetical protein EK904_014654 [Melospiza melodia maxima]|nr:hypothetical protein EK904_014654 [Melospiza melodia maxima]
MSDMGIALHHLFFIPNCTSGFSFPPAAACTTKGYAGSSRAGWLFSPPALSLSFPPWIPSGSWSLAVQETELRRRLWHHQRSQRRAQGGRGTSLPHEEHGVTGQCASEGKLPGEDTRDVEGLTSPPGCSKEME